MKELMLLSRFFNYVDFGSSCWEWTSSIDSKGYGRLTVNYKSIRAHRLSMLLHGYEIKNKCVLHHCDNRRCVNPEHLYLGTAQDNADDRVNRGRWKRELKKVCINGHPLSGNNVYIRPSNGDRSCRICSRIRVKQFYRNRRNK